MWRFIYQANFCAECGNALRPRRVWWPRYFCEVCAPQVKRRVAQWRLLAPLGLVIGTLGLAFATHDGSPPAPARPAAAVSAFDAAAQPKAQTAAPAQSAEPRVFCGARTRRRTPCRRLVPPGERCAQHHGMPSMLAAKTED